MDQKDKRNEQEIKEVAGVKPEEKLTDDELQQVSGGAVPPWDPRLDDDLMKKMDYPE